MLTILRILLVINFFFMSGYGFYLMLTDFYGQPLLMPISLVFGGLFLAWLLVARVGEV